MTKSPRNSRKTAVVDGFFESKITYIRLFFVPVAASSFLSFVLRDLSTAFFLYRCHKRIMLPESKGLKSKSAVYEKKGKK